MPVSFALELPFRAPLWPDSLFGHLTATGIPGVEEWRDGAYRRTLRLPGGPGVVALAPAEGAVRGELRLASAGDRAAAVAACRRVLDLDADPLAADAVLSEDPCLAPVVVAAPGRRVPGTVDGAELAVRAVLGQAISTAAARTHAARLVAAHGEPIADPAGGLTHLFPSVEALRDLDPERLALPRPRRTVLTGLVAALARGELDLDPGGDAERTRAHLLALPGIGPWTVETIAMRALGDADAFLPTDLGIRAAAVALELPATPGALTARAERWRPWRAYAVQYLWGTSDHAINRLPTG